MSCWRYAHAAEHLLFPWEVGVQLPKWWGTQHTFHVCMLHPFVYIYMRSDMTLSDWLGVKHQVSYLAPTVFPQALVSLQVPSEEQQKNTSPSAVVITKGLAMPGGLTATSWSWSLTLWCPTCYTCLSLSVSPITPGVGVRLPELLGTLYIGVDKKLENRCTRETSSSSWRAC